MTAGYKEERNSYPLLRSCLIGSCHVSVSKHFHVVSALQSTACPQLSVMKPKPNQLLTN